MTGLHYFLNGLEIIEIVGTEVLGRCHTSVTLPVSVDAGIIQTWGLYQHIGVWSTWGHLASLVGSS